MMTEHSGQVSVPMTAPSRSQWVLYEMYILRKSQFQRQSRLRPVALVSYLNSFLSEEMLFKRVAF